MPDLTPAEELRKAARPVDCGDDWHEEDVDLCTCCQQNEVHEEDMNEATGLDGLCDGCRHNGCGSGEDS